MNLSPLPIQKFFDNNGRPLSNGLLFTYAAGTSTKIATYVDSAGTPNSNPIVLDFRGECRLWIDPLLAYKYVLSPEGDTDPPTKPIWTVDNITAAPANSDNAAVDTGSVNNIVLAIPQISSPVAFTRIVFKAANSNTGATTITINGGTSKALTWQPNGPLSGGEIIANGIYESVFDGTQWQLQGPTLDVGDVRLYGAKGDGVTDDRVAIQAAVNAIIARGGGTVSLPAGSFLISRVASPDAQFNGIAIPFTNVFGYTSHIKMQGQGRATVLRAGDNSMTVIRLSDSNDELYDFAIDGNGKTGVTGLSLIASNTSAVGLVEHIDHNKIRVDIRNCAEGTELMSPSGGGCDYNTFYEGIWQDNTRHIRLRDQAVARGPNRNTFKVHMIGGNCGLYIDGADTTMAIGCTFEGIASGATPLATPTAVFINSVGSASGANTENNNLIDCNFESNTRDLDCSNRRTSILGGTCGNQAGGGVFGAVAGSATPDVWVGGDRSYQARELLIGGPAVDSVLLDNRIAAYLAANPQIVTSANAAGAFPFENDGSVLIQARQQAASGVQLAVGAASTKGLDVLGSGLIKPRVGSALAIQLPAVTYSASITVDASLGNLFEIVANNGTAFTINAPTNPSTGQILTVVIFNVSGGALGVVTWNAIFKLSAWTQPANGNMRAISYYYGGTAWREINRTTVDVPN